MEVNRQRQASGLKDKIPDIQKTLETVRFLKTRKVRNQKISLCLSRAGPSPGTHAQKNTQALSTLPTIKNVS